MANNIDIIAGKMAIGLQTVGRETLFEVLAEALRHADKSIVDGDVGATQPATQTVEEAVMQVFDATFLRCPLCAHGFDFKECEKHRAEHRKGRIAKIRAILTTLSQQPAVAHCSRCGKKVSGKSHEGNFIIGAFIECPACILNSKPGAVDALKASAEEAVAILHGHAATLWASAQYAEGEVTRKAIEKDVVAIRKAATILDTAIKAAEGDD